MSGEACNAQGRKENQGSGNPSEELQEARFRNTAESNASDHQNRKGGDEAQGL